MPTCERSTELNTPDRSEDGPSEVSRHKVEKRPEPNVFTHAVGATNEVWIFPAYMKDYENDLIGNSKAFDAV